MLRSFEKNAKERKNVAFFWKEHMPNPGSVQSVCLVYRSRGLVKTWEDEDGSLLLREFSQFSLEIQLLDDTEPG